MKAEHAIKMLGKHKTIQMSRVSAFNDPFEGLACLTYDPNDPMQYIWSQEDKLRDLHEQEAYVYCLTRSPLNPVMWAHYADQH